MVELRRSGRNASRAKPVYDETRAAASVDVEETEEDVDMEEDIADDEDDAEENSEEGQEDEVDADEADPDVVVARPGTRHQKALSGGKRKGSNAHRAHGRVTGSGGSKRQRRPGACADDDDGVQRSLFDATVKGGAAMKRAAAEWVDKYKSDRDEAVADYVVFIARAAGVTCEVTAEDAGDDVDACVASIVDVATRDGGEATFTSRQKELKHFRNNFLEIAESILRECDDQEVIFDNVLLEKLIDYFIALSGAPIKPIRYASTLAGLQLVTSCVRILKRISEERDVAETQLAAEQKKSGASGRGNPRATALKRTIDSKQRHVNNLESIFKRVFSSIVVNRYRDINVDIRREVISSLGGWISLHPQFFLGDSYLKYLGWSLSDKDAGVRFAAVKALATLYSKPANLEKMELFSERFRDRIIEMASDVDAHVVAEVCSLLTRLFVNDLAAVDDLPSIVTLLIDSSAAVRRSAAELLRAVLEKNRPDEKGAGGSKKAKKKKGESGNQHVRGDLRFMAECLKDISCRPELMRLAIESLWDVIPALHDAEAAVSILLSEDGDEDSGACTDEQRSVLAWVLLASLEHVSGQYAAPRGGRGRTAALREEDKSLHQQFSLLYVSNLLPLLQRFQADERIVAALVSLVPAMKLEIFGLQRKEKIYKSILAAIRDTFFRHNAAPVLDACARTFAYCTKDAPDAMHAEGRNLLRDCAVELEAKVSNSDEVFSRLAADDGDDPDVISVRMTLMRLYRLQCNGADVISGEMFDKLRGILEKHSPGASISLLLLRAMQSWVEWQVASSSEAWTGTMSSVVTGTSLRGKMRGLIECCCQVLDSDDASSKLKERVFLMLVDTLILRHGTVADADGGTPESGDASVFKSMWAFCESVLDGFDSDELPDEEEDEEEGDEDAGDIFSARDVIAEEFEGNEAFTPLTVLVGAARLVAFGVADASASWFSEEVVSHYTEHGQTSANIVKRTMKIVRQRTDEDPWKLYFGALRCSYGRYLKETTDARFALFQDLVARISSAYGGVNVKGREHLVELVRECAHHGLARPPTRLTFVEAVVSSMASKLSPPAASQILKILKDTEDAAADSIATEAWEPLRDAVEILESRCGIDGDSDDEMNEADEAKRHVGGGGGADDGDEGNRGDGAKLMGRKIVFGDPSETGDDIDDDEGDGGHSERSEGAGRQRSGPAVKDLIAHYEAASGAPTASDSSPSRMPLHTATNIQKTQRGARSGKQSVVPEVDGAVVPPVNRRSSRRALV